MHYILTIFALLIVAGCHDRIVRIYISPRSQHHTLDFMSIEKKRWSVSTNPPCGGLNRHIQLCGEIHQFPMLKRLTIGLFFYSRHQCNPYILNITYVE